MAYGLAQDGRDIDRIELIDVGIELLQNVQDQSARACLLERHLEYLAIGGCLDAIDDALVVGRNNLAAGTSIALESIVRRRVMRRRDHDAGVATEVADSAGEERRGARLRDEKDHESSGREHARRTGRRIHRTGAAYRRR